MLERIDPVAFEILERAQAGNVQILDVSRTVDVEIVGQQRVDADAQDRVFGAVDEIVVHRRRCIVYGRKVDLDTGRTLAAELVAHDVVEEGIAVLVRRAEEFDHPVFVDGRGTVDRAVDTYECEVGDVLRVVLDQIGRIDQDRLVFLGEAHDVVGGIEAADALQRVDRIAIPHGAVVEDDFLDARFAAEEVVGDADRVDQEAIVALEFEEQVVPVAQDGYILRSDGGIEHDAVDIGSIADFVDRVLVAFDTEDVAVRAEAAGDDVLAEAAFEGLVRRAAGEAVVMDRADQHFDVHQRIAERFPGKAGARCQVDFDRFVGLAVVGDVEAFAPVDHVGTATAADAVVARIAADGVVVIGTLDDFDIAEGVTECVAAAGTAVDHVDRHAFDRERVVGDIDAFAALQHVRAASADEDVVASAADEHVVAALAGEEVVAFVALEGVGEVRTDEVFDRGKDVALGLAAGCRACEQRDVHACAREFVDRGIVTLAAVDHVGTDAARQRIVACAAEQRVVAATAFDDVAALEAFETVVRPVAAELVVPDRADQRFDADVDIALRKAALADA